MLDRRIDDMDESTRIQHIMAIMMLVDREMTSSGRRGSLDAIDDWYVVLSYLIGLFGVDRDRVMERIEAGDGDLPA
jgi:hypothetical protein